MHMMCKSIVYVVVVLAGWVAKTQPAFSSAFMMRQLILHLRDVSADDDETSTDLYIHLAESPDPKLNRTPFRSNSITTTDQARFQT
eukprot:1840815-Amphidinium_carterae.1